MPTIQVGAVLIEESPRMRQVLGLESQPYSGNWRLIKALAGFSFDRKIREITRRFHFVPGDVFDNVSLRTLQGVLQNWCSPFEVWREVYFSEASKRRSRCGSVRGRPVLSSHFSPGLAPQVGQRIVRVCSFLVFMAT
jgi:hypothetical protein